MAFALASCVKRASDKVRKRETETEGKRERMRNTDKKRVMR